MLTWLTGSIDSRPVGLARLIIGTAATIKLFVALPILMRLNEATTLKATYVGWFPDPTPSLVFAIVAVWLISAVLFTIGWHVAVSGPVLLAVITFTLALDQQTYSNHLYLLAWLVLLLTMADSGAGLNVRRTNRPVVRWPVVLLMSQVSIVYGFSALTKINDSFLYGHVLAGFLRDGVIPFPESLRTPPILTGMALVVIAVELTLALLIWVDRYRPTVFILGLGLHVSITMFMAATAELAVFSMQMLALYPLFLMGEKLDVRLQSGCSGCDTLARRFRRYDVLWALNMSEQLDQTEDLVLLHRGEETFGGDAHTRVLEHLVPWLWVAPLLRLPVIRRWHNRRHQRLVKRPLSEQA